MLRDLLFVPVLGFHFFSISLSPSLSVLFSLIVREGHDLIVSHTVSDDSQHPSRVCVCVCVCVRSVPVSSWFCAPWDDWTVIRVVTVYLSSSNCTTPDPQYYHPHYSSFLAGHAR